MKYLVVVLLAAVVLAGHGKDCKERQEKRKQQNKLCVDESKVDTSFLEKASKGEFENDTLFKKYLVCTFQNRDKFNKDGTLNMEHFQTKLMKKEQDETKRKEIMDACIQNKENMEETAFYVTKCLYKYFPEKYANKFQYQ